MSHQIDLTFSDDPERFRRLGYLAVDLATDYLSHIRKQPVFHPMTPPERQELLEEKLTEEGIAPEELLADIRDHIFTHPMGNGHPRFFGWVNSPPASLGILADLLAATLNPSCAGGDHAAIYLEHCVVRWLMELLDFPSEHSTGLLVSGGSMASLTCLTAARYWVAKKEGWNIRKQGLNPQHPQLMLYTSQEGHSCIHKTVELLGLGSDAIHIVPTDNDFRINIQALREAIRADREAGRRPFCIVASAGTVNTGAIDPLNTLADICAEEDLWLHVDGAYGAVGKLDPAAAPLFAGLKRVHSLAIDPHKWLSVPVECGCALVYNKQLLRETFSLVPAYLQVEEGKGFAGLPWFSEYGFQQTRGFRALKLWIVLQSMGRQGLAQRISRHNTLAQHLASLIDTEPDFERVAPVSLSIVCFRYVPSQLHGNEPAIEQLNRAIVPAIQASGEAFLTGTELRDQFALRACILHDATTEADIAALIEIIRRIGETITRQA
ncbi:amino acid decarboxylase [Reticulibacter mediterranei]|uniref:Amino acid decarboxylase n=1 Tax=Reticulibacter mediterranei TaxID=2778369 RepID=A0A8J3N0A1_9CHLR|nr:pyridoxal-dependent decarboxylase [Reticulibacter mediterranei]GHO91030.1 amino acid decarboxylase [Reticulibacter mediterranei]